MNVRRWFFVRGLLVLIVVTGLAADAYVHFDLASTYDAVRSRTLSQGDLFRVEAVAAALAAVALIVRPRLYTALFALLVAGGGVAAVLIYRWTDVGAFGPLPDMYEPFWYPQKTQSAYAEGLAAIAAFVLVTLIALRRWRSDDAPAHTKIDDQPTVVTYRGGD